MMGKKRINRISVIIYCIIFGFIFILCFLSLFRGTVAFENETELNIHILTYILMLIVCFGLFCSILILIVFAGLNGINIQKIGSEFIKQDGKYPVSSNDLFTGIILMLIAEIFSDLFSKTGFRIFLIFNHVFSIFFIISIVISLIAIYLLLNQNSSQSIRFKYLRPAMRSMIIGLLLLISTNQYVIGFIYKNLFISNKTALLILIFTIILCYFWAMSFCQFSNLYCFLGIIFNKKDAQKNQKNFDILKQWNENRKIALLDEINEADSKSEMRGFFKKCVRLFRLDINSFKSFIQARGYIVAYIFLLTIQRINKLFSNLLEEDRMRRNMMRFCAISVVAEFLVLDIFLFTFWGEGNSCSRFFELVSTVVIIPILLAALLNLRASKQKSA